MVNNNPNKQISQINLDIIKEIYNNYPNIKDHPIMSKNANNIYKKLSNEDLDAYYFTLMNLPTPKEKEKHRHTATAALLTQKYPLELVRELGQIKEYSDLKNNQSIDNSIFDMLNNERGMKIGKDFPDINRYSIYDYVMKNIRNDIEKYPPYKK